MSSFLGFVKSTSKVALAIFAALLGLGIVGAMGTWAVTSYQAREAKPYEEVREWDVDLTKNLQMKLKARTKVVSEMLMASFRFSGFPPYLSLPVNQNAGFTLHFLDKDGFKVHSKEMKFSDFSSIVGPDGKKVGLDIQTQDYMPVEKYKRFDRLTVEWTFQTEVPKEPQWEDAPVLLDHCAPNLSRAERLKRLAQYGTVRETGTGSYSAGGRSIHFFYDGSLLSCV